MTWTKAYLEAIKGIAIIFGIMLGACAFFALCGIMIKLLPGILSAVLIIVLLVSVVAVVIKLNEF